MNYKNDDLLSNKHYKIVRGSRIQYTKSYEFDNEIEDHDKQLNTNPTYLTPVIHGDNTSCKQVKDLSSIAQRVKFNTDMGQSCSIYIYNKYLIMQLKIILCNINKDTRDNVLSFSNVKKYLVVLAYLLSGTFLHPTCDQYRDGIDYITRVSDSQDVITRLKSFMRVSGVRYINNNDGNITLACEEMLNDYITIFMLIQDIMSVTKFHDFVTGFTTDSYRNKFSEDKQVRYEKLKAEVTMYINIIYKTLKIYTSHNFSDVLSNLTTDEGNLKYNLDS